MSLLDSTPHSYTKSLVIREVPKFKKSYTLIKNTEVRDEDPYLFTLDDIPKIRAYYFQNPLTVWSVYHNATDNQVIVENALYYDNVKGYYVSEEPAKVEGELYSDYVFDALSQLTATPEVIELVRDLLDEHPSKPDMPLEIHLTYLLNEAVLKGRLKELSSLEKDLIDTSTLLVKIDPCMRPHFLDFLENEKLVPTSPYFSHDFKETLDDYKKRNPKATLVLEDLIFMLTEVDENGLSEFKEFYDERMKKNG